jgi:hypothetical protein
MTFKTRCGCGKVKADKAEVCAQCLAEKTIAQKNKRIADLELIAKQRDVVVKDLQDKLNADAKKNNDVAKWPMHFEIAGYSASCTKSYLTELLRTIAPYTDSINIKWYERTK